MRRLVSGGGATTVRNKAVVVTGNTPQLNLSRLLGAQSSFSLRTGSDANLSVTGNTLVSSTSLSENQTRIALVRESDVSGEMSRIVEYAVTLVGGGIQSPSQPEESSPIYLQDLGQFAGVYGLKQLIQEYAGPSLRVRRASDGFETDIGFEEGALDLVAALTAKGASDLTVATVYDQTGQERHLTQPNTASQPRLWLGEGGPTITNYTGDNPLLIPSSVKIERNDCAVFLVARTPGQGATCGYWAFGTSTIDFGITSPRTAGNLAIQPNVAGVSQSALVQNAQACGVNNASVIGLVSNTQRQTVYRDGQAAHYPAASAARLSSGGEVGEAINYDGRCDWQSFVVCSYAPSELELAEITSVLSADFTALSSPSLSFLAGGDSIIFGTGGSNNRTITAAMHARSTPDVVFRNVGIAGHRLEGHYQDFDTLSDAYLTPNVTNVYFANYGHNDIKTMVVDQSSITTTVQTMQEQVRHMSAKLRAYGFDLVIWQECFADIQFTPQQEEARLIWNAWLRSNPIADDGLLCFGAVDCVATDTAFVLSDFETAAGRGMALSVNASDGVHPNEIHAGVRAEHLLATIAAIPFQLHIPIHFAQVGSLYQGAVPKLMKGTAPFQFGLAPNSASLPDGLEIDPGTGVISGIPVAAGSYTDIIVRVTDSAMNVADAVLSLDVAAAPMIAIVDQIVSWNATDAVSSFVNLPQDIDAGDLLVAIMTVDGNPTVTWDSQSAGEWTLSARYLSNLNAQTLLIYSKVANGSEGGSALTISFSNAQQSVTRILRVTGAEGSAEISAYARNSSDTIDPPNMLPSWNGSSLIVALAALDGTATVLSGPQGFSAFSAQASSNSGQSTNIMAWKITQGAENPDVFTLSGAGQWVAATLALRSQ